MDIIDVNTYTKRLFGMIFVSKRRQKIGMLFKHCSRVHTYFMRFTIVVVALDSNFEIIATQIVTPWKISKKIINCSHILEYDAALIDVYSEETILSFIKEAMNDIK